MIPPTMFYLETKRLFHSPWIESDRERVIALYADPMASRDFDRTFRAEESSATFEKYLEAFSLYGFTRWKLTL